MGTPAFAVPSLRALSASHEVLAVYTRPDARAGRGRALTSSAVAETARELGLSLVQPPTLRAAGAAARLRDLEPDVVCVAAYALILPPQVLAVPALGCLNVHGSLLPRWRGAAPVQRAILAGDPSTGVSIMRMEEGLDTGPWCVQRTVPVDEHTTETLTAALAALGAEALLDALSALEAGTVRWVPQDDALATYAAKISRDDVALSPELAIADASRRVRASSAQAAARACIAGVGVTVREVASADDRISPGTVHVHKDALLLGFADGSLAVRSLTPEGRRPMEGAAFARGARLESGSAWSACRGG